MSIFLSFFGNFLCFLIEIQLMLLDFCVQNLPNFQHHKIGKQNPHLIKIPQMSVQMKTTSFQRPIHKLKDLKFENPFDISGYISTWASLTIITSFSKKFKNFKKIINLYYMGQLNNNYIILKNVEIFKFLKKNFPITIKMHSINNESKDIISDMINLCSFDNVFEGNYEIIH